jgi:hypothetical protein
VPPDIEALVFSSMAKDPAARPQSMSEFEQRLQEIASRCFTADALVASPFGHGSGGQTPRPVVLHGASHAAGGKWGGLLSDRRRVAAAAGAACMVLMIAAFGIGRSRVSGRPDRVQVSSTATAQPPPPATAQPQALPSAGAPGVGLVAPRRGGESTSTDVAPQPALAALAATDQANPRDEDHPAPEAPVAADGESADGPGHPASTVAKVRAAGGNGAVAAPSTAEQRKLLDEAEGLLRTQHFAEARTSFSRLAKNRQTRARAFVALAEIAFQEKNYQETIRSAKLAAERGGGARAHVLLGDAHFRLNEFPAAVTAYQQALRFDPANSSAKSGLALANKRL